MTILATLYTMSSTITLQVKGVGGSFSLYSDTVEDFANLNELLQTGGFTDEITICDGRFLSQTAAILTSMMSPSMPTL